MPRATSSIALLLVAAFLSGCLAAANVPFAASDEATPESHALLAGAALWSDPQNGAHPAWGWATLSQPPAGASIPTWWRPLPAAVAPESIEGLQHVKSVPANIRGAGIALFGSLAVVPGFNADTHLVSLADPANPVVLSTIQGRHRGAAVIAYPTGQLVAVFSTNSDIEFYDITDPAAPVFLAERVPKGASHKVGVVPGTPIVYNANSRGRGAQMEIFDATDPANPVLVQNFGNAGCHHVYFWITPAKQRAICAGVESTRILDIADPRQPQLVVDVPVHHGMPGTPSTGVSPARFSHFSILSEDGTMLIVGDETGGGAAPGCDVHAQALGLSASGPLGNVYFYDLADERAPQLRGWFNPGAHYLAQTSVPGSCTAHHGRLVPDPEGGRDLLAMAFYSAGVVLIDFTDPSAPQLVDQWARGTTWEVWYANGWLVTGDLSRGLDVLRLR